MNEEMATRARRYLKSRGETEHDSDVGYYVRFVYVGKIFMALDSQDRLEIVVADYPPHIIYEQKVPGQHGKMLFLEYASEVLKVLRTEMLLEDLADV